MAEGTTEDVLVAIESLGAFLDAPLIVISRPNPGASMPWRAQAMKKDNCDYIECFRSNGTDAGDAVAGLYQEMRKKAEQVKLERENALSRVNKALDCKVPEWAYPGGA